MIAVQRCELVSPEPGSSLDAALRCNRQPFGVLDKLTLRDRTQVMVYALKRGLVRPDDLA